jgi:hypothetical protein
MTATPRSLSSQAELREGKLTRTADRLTSRTLLTEVDVDNARGELLPGAYAEVHFKLPAGASTFRLPVNAVIFGGEGVRVAAVKNGHAALTPAPIARAYGNNNQTATGRTGNKKIIMNPPDSLKTRRFRSRTAK